jgi:HEAT repeat protein
MCFVWLPAYQLSASEQSVTTKAWTVLDAGLHDQKAATRIQAISALGIIPGNRRAIEIAEQTLQDSNSDVCRAAISALGEMNSKGSLSKIKALISRSDAKTVVAIAAVLTKFKDPKDMKFTTRF